MSKCLVLLLATSWCTKRTFAVTIGMQPLRESDAPSLPQIKGIYFEPIGSSDYVCHKNLIPRDCNGTLAVDLSKDSSITFEWVASDSSSSKYISLRGAGQDAVNFEFLAQFACDGAVPKQAIDGDKVSVSFDFIPNAAVGEFSYNQGLSFIDFEKFGGNCRISSVMQFGAGPSGELNLDITRASFTVNYNNTNVVQGSQLYSIGTSKHNWINFGSTASDSTIYSIKSLPVDASSPTTAPPNGAPIVPSDPTPTLAPAPTESSSDTDNNRGVTSGGSSGCSFMHFAMSTVGIIMTLLYMF